MSKTLIPTEPAVRKPLMDDTMRLAAKLDRILAEIPEWGRTWALAYLNAKYAPEDPNAKFKHQPIPEKP